HVRRGGKVLGLCGGYQMLGARLDDPDGTEGPAGAGEGLGLLAGETGLAGHKALSEVGGTELTTGPRVRGYEMHVGGTPGADCARPMLALGGRADGAISGDGRVMGTYVHGIFADDDFRHAFLNRIKTRVQSGLAYEAQVDAVLDELADHLERHADTGRILDLARPRAR